MRKDASPEEKLLNIIRVRKDKGDASEKKDPYFKRFETSGMLSGNISISQKKYASIERKWLHRISELKYVNIILFLILIVVGGYLIFELFSPKESPLEEIKIVKELEITEPKKAGQNAGEEKPLSYYSENVGGKNLFRSGMGQEENQGRPKVVDEEKIAKEVISNLSLMGIIKGDNPQAIIEDKKAQKSYFLNKGDTIGEIEVIEIFENKVIIEYNGKQYELIL